MKCHREHPITGQILNTLLKKTKLVSKIVVVTTPMFALTGCLIISPYWNQEFASHTNEVPLQAFTLNASEVINFQCAQASHGGLHPFGSPPTWININNVPTSATPSYDPAGGKMYGAGISTKLPSSCWRQDPANSIYYTAVRARPADSTTAFVTFTKPGLECLGREIGKMANWLGWYGKGCNQTYSGSSTAIPYVIIRAEA